MSVIKVFGHYRNTNNSCFIEDNQKIKPLMMITNSGVSAVLIK